MAGTPPTAAEAPNPENGKCCWQRKDPLPPEYQDQGKSFVKGCEAAQTLVDYSFPSSTEPYHMEQLTKQPQKQMEVVQEHVSRAKHILYDLHELGGGPVKHWDFKREDLETGHVTV